MVRLEGQTALVTGGSRGIGRAIMLELAHLGCDVGTVFIGDVQEVDALSDEVKKKGRRFWSHVVDVRDRAQVRDAVEAIVSTFGRLDILINNAGIIRDSMSWKMSDEAWDSVIDVNLTGCFNVSRAAIPVMRSNGFGRIVNITSINGLRGKVGQANYSAAKAGLVGLTKTLAKELAGSGITVNAVAPGMVETEMWRSIPPEVQAQSLRDCPMGRPAKAEEVASLVAYLCSRVAGYITGEVIKIDGGLYI